MGALPGVFREAFRTESLDDQLVATADFASLSIAGGRHQSSSIISNTTAPRLLSSVKESFLCGDCKGCQQGVAGWHRETQCGSPVDSGAWVCGYQQTCGTQSRKSLCVLSSLGNSTSVTQLSQADSSLLSAVAVTHCYDKC